MNGLYFGIWRIIAGLETILERHPADAFFYVVNDVADEHRGRRSGRRMWTEADGRGHEQEVAMFRSRITPYGQQVMWISPCRIRYCDEEPVGMVIRADDLDVRSGISGVDPTAVGVALRLAQNPQMCFRFAQMTMVFEPCSSGRRR